MGGGSDMHLGQLDYSYITRGYICQEEERLSKEKNGMFPEGVLMVTGGLEAAVGEAGQLHVVVLQVQGILCALQRLRLFNGAGWAFFADFWVQIFG